MMEHPYTTFGSYVFSDKVMKARLPGDAYKRLSKIIEGGGALDNDLADIVAGAMKDWAIENGATHYIHWFQPMTNMTAGKYDSFLSTMPDGSVFLEFSGKMLIMGEPDASSFPTGGLRDTFEARGYTMWDPSSPAFLRGGSLYIPTAFCSYNGEALDKKTPLLRSMQVLDHETMRVLRALGNTTSQRATPTVGAEQEYFLIDRALYEQRLDLKLCGRTLLGAKLAKGQELDDHYCGRIRLRVQEFMKKVDEELWKLGVCSKTKHNEVAPTQHELACYFSSANITCDQNQLVMEVMRTEAKKLGLACLLHEKPFSGVNGSGKHNNWSIATDDGINLLSPGDKPQDNDVFLVFVSAVLAAVDNYQDLIRMSAASAGNDYRLGAAEAPPAIISIFLGDALTNVLKSVAADREADYHTDLMSGRVSMLPEFERDNSDRNRTSPFAFTGNKFEFRMLGAPASISDANYILNTAVADELSRIADRLEGAADVRAEVRAIVRDTMEHHRRIIFNGNNYSQEWVELAAKRGLLNVDNTPDSFEAMIAEKNIALFSRYSIFSDIECHARYDIMHENYQKVVSIEALTLIEMVRRQVLPAVIDAAGSVCATLSALKAAGISCASAQALALRLAALADEIDTKCSALEAAHNELLSIESLREQSRHCHVGIRGAMQALRVVCDEAETIVEDDMWPMPTYTDLMHRV